MGYDYRLRGRDPVFVTGLNATPKPLNILQAVIALMRLHRAGGLHKVVSTSRCLSVESGL
ncbi:MAG: hypothetical protein C5S49_01945 [Candidatus Methanogaster sp.]|nr:MAG: hypothetical protein C5S49_01945 [ANME-2 cluster archaeon]